MHNNYKKALLVMGLSVIAGGAAGCASSANIRRTARP